MGLTALNWLTAGAHVPRPAALRWSGFFGYRIVRTLRQSKTWQSPRNSDSSQFQKHGEPRIVPKPPHANSARKHPSGRDRRGCNLRQAAIDLLSKRHVRPKRPLYSVSIPPAVPPPAWRPVEHCHSNFSPNSTMKPGRAPARASILELRRTSRIEPPHCSLASTLLRHHW